jgi:hypothetical protein
MPHFLCPRCALRAYSAAGESRCPSCDTPLGRDDHLRVNIPPRESLSGRFRTVAHDATREAGRG